MMKTKRFFWLMLMLVASLAVAGCSDDDDNPGDPNASVPDPEGTITVRMMNRNNGRTEIFMRPNNGGGWFYLDEGNNFTGSVSMGFCCVGKVKGLGNITEIPEEGYAHNVAVMPGYGYVINDGGIIDYIRLYAEEYIVNTSGGIIGVSVKYQRFSKTIDSESLEIFSNSLKE